MLSFLLLSARLFFGGLACYWCLGTFLEGVAAVFDRQWALAFADFAVSAFSLAAALSILIGMRPLKSPRRDEARHMAERISPGSR